MATFLNGWELDENRRTTNIVDFEKARLNAAVKRGYRNWASQFGETFGLETRLDHLSIKSVAFLAQGREKSPFYLYDLIMNLLNLGSGFEFHALNSRQKIGVVDRYLFLLDRIRFEYMKRMGWLERYPGEEFTLVELIAEFEALSPRLQSDIPTLSRDHPDYRKFNNMHSSDREQFVRKLIPKALQGIDNHSTTL